MHSRRTRMLGSLRGVEQQSQRLCVKLDRFKHLPLTAQQHMASAALARSQPQPHLRSA